MSALPPEYQGLKRVLSRNLVRYKDTDGSIVWFKNLAIMVVYTNRNPDADGLRLWLTVNNQNTSKSTIPTPYQQTSKKIVIFDLEDVLPDNEFPPFISTSKPPWTSVAQYPATETFNVTPGQYEGYFIVFRNTSSTVDTLHVVVNGDEFTESVSLTPSQGYLLIPIFNPTTELVTQEYKWWCENGYFEKMIINATGINNAVAKTIRVNYEEYKDTSGIEGTYGYFDEIIQLISLQLV
jgi:hypothetical protein